MIEVINLRYENLTDFEKKYGAPFVEAPETSRGKVKKATITSRTKVIDATADDIDISDEVEVNDEPDLDDTMGEDDLGGDGLNNEEDLPDDETVPDVDETEDTGTTDGEETTADVPDTGTEGEITEPAPDTTGETGEAGTDETNPAPEGEDDEVVADDTDEVDIDDADGGDDGAGQDNGNGLGEGSGLASTQDKTDDLAHKNILFENFKNLYNSVDKYEAKLATTIGISAEKGEQLNEIRMEFKRIKDLLYDYMIIKFKKKSYAENYLFYKRGVAATNIVLEILDDVWSAEDNNDVEED